MISKAKTWVLSIKTGSIQSGLEDSAISAGNGGEGRQTITGDHPVLTSNQFPDFIHAVKTEPDRGFPLAASAHDTFRDYISLTPETPV